MSTRLQVTRHHMNAVIKTNTNQHQHEDDAQQIESAVDECSGCIGERTTNHECQERQERQLDSAKYTHKEGSTEH